MPHTLTLEQGRRLVWNIKKWARILDETARALSKFPDELMSLFKTRDFSRLSPEQLREVRSSVFGSAVNVHMLVICLRQIDEYARELQESSMWGGAVGEKGASFRALFESAEIRDLRNVLEHGAEYIVGKGRKPELMIDQDADWPSVLLVDGKATRIGVFGKPYEVKPIIIAAIELAKALPSQSRS